MSTETLLPPPAIDADTLTRLLDDRERVCEIPTRAHADTRPPATWAISGVCSLCGTETLLACDRCKRRFERSGAMCEIAKTPVRITWMEPL